MTLHALTADRIVTGDPLRRAGAALVDHVVLTDHAVVVDGARIVDVCARADLPAGVRRTDFPGATIAPGLVDLHMHGMSGQSFEEATAAELTSMRADLAARGVTSVVPTFITRPFNELLAALDRIRPAVEGSPTQPPGCRLLGVHLEGPYLSPHQRGAHPQALLREPSAADLDALRAFRSVLRIVTIAPELPGAADFIREITSWGVVASVGHSEAGRDDVAAAREAGASHFTHLWSGQSSVHRLNRHRVPGLLEVALSQTGMTAEVIADGPHLPPELLEIARKCFGDNLCIVSDAVDGAGLPEGTVFGGDALPRKVEGGVAVVIGDDCFGGSTTLLPQMITRVVSDLGWPLAEAWAMGSTTPARVLGMSDRIGALTGGALADLVVLDPAPRKGNAGPVAVAATMIGGDWIHGKPDDA
ncbi:N-acetylglucosamine-6-phosphate deacetylase [Sanguibacter gelidistatuariae]|uniref:N-acetylglucosamine-6-phosphate deacetylase n=1 Tax=Sanguibacter gelidistatuariae TaxID=1814289 RepID=A0A1G6ULQ2_9MICO|nr:N-acetylglucosamine-6-phosphate deacetylase [Sanguibacter gelidistatuariae]SDD41465.1 N-acetylglucosamine-6-phosphate deacetylase [Sanguibacter gelidistatuariae]